MKKFLLSVGLAAVFAVSFLTVGCNWMYNVAEPVDVCLEYLDAAADPQSDSAAEYVAKTRQAAVVSVIATYNLRTDYGTTYTQVYSGVIIDKEGYVLTSSVVANFEYSDGHYIRPSSVRAVLSDVYDDGSKYALDLVNYDSDAGLALYSFHDNFYHYTDSSASETTEGFQVWAGFSLQEASVGQTCILIGNAVGALNSNFNGYNGISYVQQSVTQGVVSSTDVQDAAADIEYNGASYARFLFSAPSNENMYGGALFDENGYMIGLVQGQLTDGSSEEICLVRVSAALPASLVAAYIDTVSEQEQTVIPYTVAIAATDTADQNGAEVA